MFWNVFFYMSVKRNQGIEQFLALYFKQLPSKIYIPYSNTLLYLKVKFFCPTIDLFE